MKLALLITEIKISTTRGKNSEWRNFRAPKIPGSEDFVREISTGQNFRGEKFSRCEISSQQNYRRRNYLEPLLFALLCLFVSLLWQ